MLGCKYLVEDLEDEDRLQQPTQALTIECERLVPLRLERLLDHLVRNGMRYATLCNGMRDGM